MKINFASDLVLAMTGAIAGAITVAVIISLALACSNSEFKGGVGGKKTADHAQDAGLPPAKKDTPPSIFNDPGPIQSPTPENTLSSPKIIDSDLGFDPGGRNDILSNDGLSRLCTQVSNLKMTIISDANLPVNSGYAATEGTATFSIRADAVSAKGYFISVGQDDAGVWLKVNGESVLTMKDGQYAAATWRFEGKDAPIAFEAPENISAPTRSWIQQIGGIQNAMTSIRQGFSVRPGANTIAGNVKDVYGVYRSINVTLQMRLAIPLDKTCE